MRKRLQAVVTIALVAGELISCGKGNKSGQTADEQPKSGEAQSGQTKSNHGRPSQSGLVHITLEAQHTANMQVVVVESRPVLATLSVAGQIMANEEQTAHIGSYVSGRVLELKANVGDRVKAGEVLARMHSHEVHETLAAYRTAQQDVSHQQSALEYSTRMRDRMQRLYGLQFASSQEVERADADLRTQSTNLANAKISLQREGTHLSDLLHMPESELLTVDESNDEVPVIASITGIVTARMISPGSVVEPGQEVYTVTDMRNVWMMASVFEPDSSRVRLGLKAVIRTQAYPDQQFRGTVTRIGAELDPKTRTLQVRLVVPNPGDKLRVAMYANAELQQRETRPALFVPEEAMQDVNGGTVVFVRRGPEDFEVQPVSVASRADGEALIESGLKPGDQIVVRSSFLVKSELLKSQIGE